jgi:hypothetical protein
MIRNITLRTPPTPEEVAEREAFLEQNRIEASALSERLRQRQEQARQAEFQNRLVEKTQLSLEQLQAIKDWLSHNLQLGPGIVQSYTEIR